MRRVLLAVALLGASAAHAADGLSLLGVSNVFVSGMMTAAVSPIQPCATSCATIDSLATINATPQGQATASSYTVDGSGNVELVFASNTTLANNGTYSLNGTGTACDTDWRVTMVDARHVTLQASSATACKTAYTAGLTAGATLSYPFAPVTGFAEADFNIIGVNGCRDVHGDYLDCNHTITIGASHGDRAGISKVVLFLSGTKLTLTTQTFNTRTSTYGFAFTPRSGDFAAGNGHFDIFADVYPVNGLVRRIQLPITLDTSSIATAMTRHVYYLDGSAGSDADSTCSHGVGGTTPWKTVRFATWCAGRNYLNGGDIIYVNPANTVYDDCQTSVALGACPAISAPFNNVHQTILTSGVYSAGGPVPSTTKWQYTRHNRYAADSNSPTMATNDTNIMLDRVSIDTAKVGGFSSPGPSAVQGIVLSNCTFTNSGDDGLYGVYNGTTMVPVAAGIGTTYNNLREGEPIFGGGYGAIQECSGQVGAIAGGNMIRNVSVSTAWDMAYIGDNNVTYWNSSVFSNSAAGNYRTFNYQSLNTDITWQYYSITDRLTATGVSYNSLGYSTITSANVYANGTLTTTGSPATTFAITGTQMLDTSFPAEHMGVDNVSVPGGIEWTGYFPKTHPATGLSNPIGSLTAAFSGGALTGVPYYLQQIRSQGPSGDNYNHDVMFTTGNDATLIDRSETTTSGKTCSFHYRYLGSGAMTGLRRTETPGAYNYLYGAPTLTFAGSTVTESVATAGIYFYPGMIITEGGNSATVVDNVDLTHFTVTNSTIPDGALPSDYDVNDGITPTVVVNGDVTHNCAYVYPTNPGVGGTGTGAGALPGDQFVIRGAQHPDTMQLQQNITPTPSPTSAQATMSNIYNQHLTSIGFAQPIFLVQYGTIAGSGTISIAAGSKTAYISNATIPQVLQKYQSIQTTDTSLRYAIVAADTTTAVSPAVTAVPLMAAMPATVSPVSFYIGSAIEGVSFVNSIIATSTPGYQGQIGQGLGITNLSFIQSDVALPNPGLGMLNSDFYVRQVNVGSGFNGITFLDSAIGGIVIDNTNGGWIRPIDGSAGAQPSPGFNPDNYCIYNEGLFGTILPGNNVSSCSGATFTGMNYVPTGLTQTSIGKISGAATSGPPLYPYWFDGTARPTGGLIGAMHP